MNPGSFWFDWRFDSNSYETTLPMLGATLPISDVGLRAICAQICCKECTRAGARRLRTIAILLMCVAMVGINPCGKSTPLYMVGLKSAGVHEPTFRSKVSTWLGAPCM